MFLCLLAEGAAAGLYVPPTASVLLSYVMIVDTTRIRRHMYVRVYVLTSHIKIHPDAFVPRGLLQST